MKPRTIVALIACLSTAPLTVLAQPAPGHDPAETPASTPAKVSDSPPGPMPDPVASAEADPVGMIVSLVESIKAGEWRIAASVALALMMFVLARVRRKVKWFAGDRGGATLVGLLAMAGAIATALASGTALDWRLFLGAAGVMWTAVGGITWAKRLIWPKDGNRPETA